MKKRIVALCLALALLPCLCAAAAPALTGQLQSESRTVRWQLDDAGTLILEDALAEGESVFAAGYDRDGRFVGAKQLTANAPSVQLGSQATWAKLIWTSQALVPQSAPQSFRSNVTDPVRVITTGIETWADVTDEESDVYVCGEFAPQCQYFLNDQPASEVEVQRYTKLRGTRTAFYADHQDRIAAVRCYCFGVFQLTDDPVTKTLSDGTVQIRVPGLTDVYQDADCFTGLEGLKAGDAALFYSWKDTSAQRHYVLEKAPAVTGVVTTVNSRGHLTIDGQTYRASSVSGTGYGHFTITDAAFADWRDFYEPYHFYLDPAGDICWISPVDEDRAERVCLVLDSKITGSALWAKLLFADGTTQTVQVSKVAGKRNGVETGLCSVTDAESTGRFIRTDDAQKILMGSDGQTAQKKFFGWKATADGYELIELSTDGLLGCYWEDPVTLGDGRETVAHIYPESAFAHLSSDSGSWRITANSRTVFLVAKTDADSSEVSYHAFRGFKELPEMDVSRISAVCWKYDAGTPSYLNTMAGYVYLETDEFLPDPGEEPDLGEEPDPGEAPEGYIFLLSNEWVVDPDLDNVYQVRVVDTLGQPATMRVSADLRDAIEVESMKLNAAPDTILHFWAIMDIDENGVVYELGDGLESDAPVAMGGLDSLGCEIISISSWNSTEAWSSEAWSYDDQTKFIYVDLGWADNTDDPLNQRGVREPGRDVWTLSGCGTVTDPNTFFRAVDVDDTGAFTPGLKDGDEGYNPHSVTYIDVQATVIERLGTQVPTAEYVYIVRRLW